jgi:broad specificity phosphatase PhoE
VHLVSSPFLRCLETAAAVAKALKIPIQVENGFGEFLFDFDFEFDPMQLLHLKSRGAQALSEELGVEIIENEHLPGSVYPESYEEGTARIARNWEIYRQNIKEDVFIIISHLYVVGYLSEIWLGKNQQTSEEGYCKLTFARFDGEYHVDIFNDYSHIFQ